MSSKIALFILGISLIGFVESSGLIKPKPQNGSLNITELFNALKALQGNVKSLTRCERFSLAINGSLGRVTTATTKSSDVITAPPMATATIPTILSASSDIPDLIALKTAKTLVEQADNSPDNQLMVRYLESCINLIEINRERQARGVDIEDENSTTSGSVVHELRKRLQGFEKRFEKLAMDDEKFIRRLIIQILRQRDHELNLENLRAQLRNTYG